MTQWVRWTAAATASLMLGGTAWARPGWMSPLVDEAPPMVLPDNVPLGDNAQMLDEMRPGPILASENPEDFQVYPEMQPPNANEGVNAGGANLDFDFSYLSKYVYRGVNHDRVAVNGNTLNLLLDAKLTFDLDKYPHPFVGVVTDVYDSDPVSRFQEIRPFAGATLNIAPFLMEGGVNSYIYPDRESLNTAEVYGKLTFDDSVLLHGDTPLLTPYLYGAYDYVRANGWYFEAGIKHDFTFEDLGLVVTPQADVAYIMKYKQIFIITNDQDTGLQHADFGITMTYSLNTLFNVSRRYGEFDLKGGLFYTSRIDHNLTSDNVIWGGGGIDYRY